MWFLLQLHQAPSLFQSGGFLVRLSVLLWEFVLVCSSYWETFLILCCFQGILCKSSPDFFTASVLLNAFVHVVFPFNVLVSVFVFSHLQFCSFFPCTLEEFFCSCKWGLSSSLYLKSALVHLLKVSNSSCAERIRWDCSYTFLSLSQKYLTWCIMAEHFSLSQFHHTGSSCSLLNPNHCCPHSHRNNEFLPTKAYCPSFFISSGFWLSTQ